MNHDEIGHYERPLVEGGQGRDAQEIRECGTVGAALIMAVILVIASFALHAGGYRWLGLFTTIGTIGACFVGVTLVSVAQRKEHRGSNATVAGSNPARDVPLDATA